MLLNTGRLKFYVFKIANHFWKPWLNHWERPNVAVLDDVMAPFSTSTDRFCGKSCRETLQKIQLKGALPNPV